MEAKIGGLTITIDDVDADLLKTHQWRACKESRGNWSRVYFYSSVGDTQRSLHKMIAERMFGPRPRIYFRDGECRNLTRVNLTFIDPRRAAKVPVQIVMQPPTAGTKRCATCREEKSIDDFQMYLQVDRVVPRGVCKACYSFRRRSYKARVRDSKKQERGTYSDRGDEERIAKRQHEEDERVIEDCFARLREAREAVGA